MATVTPDVEFDVMEKLAALVPADVIITGATRNAWPGDVRPSKDSGVPMVAMFVQMVGSIYQGDNDTPVRRFMLEAVVRGARNGDAATRAKARRIHDAAAGSLGDAIGQWVATTSGVRYFALLPTGLQYLGPGEDDATFAVVSLEAWYAG